MDYKLLSFISSLSQIHPIEARIVLIKEILKLAKNKRDVFFHGLYDYRSVFLLRINLLNYIRAKENPSCYVTPDDTDINLKVYEKMFGGCNEQTSKPKI